jgi:putative hydrolase of the HAD superfamily
MDVQVYKVGNNGHQRRLIPTKPFKLIIFDIDNTLILRQPRPAKILLDFAQEKGLTLFSDALQRAERCSYAYYANGQADKERVLFGPDHFRRSYVATLLHAMCRVNNNGHWLDSAATYLAETPQREHCPDEVRQVVSTLYHYGYRLAAISNRDGNLRPLLARHDLSDYFMFTLSGGRAGVYKPNPEIFRIVLRTLGVAPAAALTVGDSYDADIVGAQRAGIAGVLLDPLGVFPEVKCRAIRHLNELIPWLIHC